MIEKPRYAIVYKNGHVENVKDTLNWFNILYGIYCGILGGPGVKALLRNGDIIVEDDLYKLAYRYGSLLARNVQMAEDSTREKFPEPMA